MRTVEEIASLGVINRQLAEAARMKLSAAIASGRVIRQPCEVTGETPAQAHHADYAHPLAVIWIRRREHGMVHRLLSTPSGAATPQFGERTQINIKLQDTDLETIDEAVQRRNDAAKAGEPPWTRTSYMLASTLASAEWDKGQVGANG